MNAPALESKTIVIIGGTAGLGLSAARACVEEGAHVVAVGRNPEHVAEAQRQLGDAGLVLTGDATDPQTAERAVEAAVDRFGKLDGLYHVAGGSGRRHGDGPLHELTDEGIEFTLRLNLTGLIYSNRAGVRQLMKQGTGGAILNMVSVLGYSPAPRHFGTHTYAASKAGGIGFTRSCAAYYAQHNIRFNAIAPALVATPMSERAQGNDEIMDYIATKQPLDGGRIGRPEDADGAAVFLLSDAARFVTGQTLAVDGGWSITEGQA